MEARVFKIVSTGKTFYGVSEIEALIRFKSLFPDEIDFYNFWSSLRKDIWNSAKLISINWYKEWGTIETMVLLHWLEECVSNG